ncbi:hypothetical protein DFH09DRAFT_162653 [Mycena vulgaris]|nr:hypothetical protein DFH09DRAFT_162653 [Mycena vulgaris]
MGIPRSFIALLPALAFLLVLLFAPSVNGAVTNTTVDDTSSAFTFTGSWTAVSASNPCAGCSSKPDASQTFGASWHDGNYRTGAPETTGGSFTFTGSAVYIFGIDQANSQPDVAFTLGNIQSVHHYTGTERFAYNALFFSATGLAADQTHIVNWIFNIDSSTGVGVQAALFDYAIVTSGNADVKPTSPETTSTTAPITTTITTANKQQTVTFTQTVSTSSTTTSSTNRNGLFVSSSSTPSVTTRSPTSSSTSVNPLLPLSAASLSGASLPTSELSLTSSSSSSADTPSGALSTSGPSPQSATSGQHHSNIGAIAGAVLGALAFAILALIVFLLCRRRAQRRRARENEERRAAGLTPAPPRMRRIRGNNVLQPFVDDRPPDAPLGNVFAGTLATASSSTTADPRTMPLAPLRATGAGANPAAFDTREVVAPAIRALAVESRVAAASASPSGTASAFAGTPGLPSAFVDTAAAGRFGYPPDSKTLEMSYTNAQQSSFVRQPSQSTQSGVSRMDTMFSPTDKPDRERQRHTVVSPPVLSSSDTHASERERYLEQRLATLEAHVASYLPPPYEQPEP